MLTNFYPIILDFELYDIWRIQNKEGRLSKIRELYNNTHSFFQDGDFVYGSRMEGEDIIGGHIYRASIVNDEKITASLIKHIFFRTFRKRFDVIPLQFYPFLVESRNYRDDLIRHLLPEDLQNKLAFKKHIEVQLRTMETEKGKQYGFVINLPRRWVFSITCDIIVEEGFDIAGLEVLHSNPLPGLIYVLAPDTSLVGIVRSIAGGYALVETNEGDKKYPLEELLLHKTTRNIHAYLVYKLGFEKATQIIEYVSERRETLNNHKNTYTEIQQFVNLLCRTPENNTLQLVYANKDGFSFTLNPNSHIETDTFYLKPPTFVFDAAHTKTSSSADSGLIDYGPYDSDLFSPKKIKILAICKKSNRGFFTNTLNTLFEGMPSSKYFKKGLKRKYEFQAIDYIVEEISEFVYEEYDRIITHLDEKPDIALIEIPSSFREIRQPEKNPYYLIKARLLTKDIPVQFVKSETFKTANEYILNQLALQMYAKIGGIPWVLSSSQSVDRELVIGIGHSRIYDNSFTGNHQERVVGITTFFSGDGQYLLSERAKDVPYEEYFEELLKSLRNSFNDLQRQQGWRRGDVIRLIFHIFKPIKNTEFEVVSNLVREYNEYVIQFAFVTIGKHHPFLLFDSKQLGRTDVRSRKQIGEFVPYRGKNIVIDDYSCLIQMLGTRETKSGKHGSSNPILVRIRHPEGNNGYVDVEGLLFTDLHYIVQQLFQFSYLSWRSFMPNENPATLLYSTLLSDLLGKLRRIDFWQPDTVNTSLKHKKWFL